MTALLASAGAKLLLGGKWLLQLGAAGLQWLFENPMRLVVAVLAIVLAWQLVIADPHLRAEAAASEKTAAKWQGVADQWKTNAGLWQAAHDKLLANVQAAQRTAAAADQANVERVQREYQAINERTSDDYEARLADTGAALERVRSAYAAAGPAGNQGDGAAASVPQALTARCQALGATDCDTLLAALPDQLAAAEQNTSQLIELQDYVRSSLLLDFSGSEAASSGTAGQ